MEPDRVRIGTALFGFFAVSGAVLWCQFARNDAVEARAETSPVPAHVSPEEVTAPVLELRTVDGYALALMGKLGKQERKSFEWRLAEGFRDLMDGPQVKPGDTGTLGTITVNLTLRRKHFRHVESLNPVSIPESATMVLQVRSTGGTSTWDGAYTFHARDPVPSSVKGDITVHQVESLSEELLRRAKVKLPEFDRD